MSTRRQRNWISVRKELYRQVESQVQHLLGIDSAAFSKYQSEYEKEFKVSWVPVTKDHLIETLCEAKFMFLGDFHALQQSQKAQLRVLKSLKDTRNLCLAVEFFESKHQSLVDKYLAGKLSDKDFLKSIRWHQTWGFPWDHYKPIIKWAQKHRVPVLALNAASEIKAAKSLKIRDLHSAKILAQQSTQNPSLKFVIIYGDLHLAKSHLPLMLQKQLRQKNDSNFAFVFQNSDTIYFEMLEQNVDIKVDVVQLTKNRFCLMTVPPWVKWQNYLIYLEQYHDSELEEEIDFTDDVARYLKVLGHDLKLKTDHLDFAVYSAQDSGFWKQMEAIQSEPLLRQIEANIENGVSFFLPTEKIGYLSRPSVNHAAAIAMSVLHASCDSTARLPCAMPEDFLRLIWLETIQYFGSKLINPKRKTDTLQDIKLSLNSRLQAPERIEALQLAISQKTREILFMTGGGAGKDLIPIKRVRKRSSYREAARLLGGILGEKLFYAFSRKKLSRMSLISLLGKPMGAPNFNEIYFEIVELIESYPEPFKSKTEKL